MSDLHSGHHAGTTSVARRSHNWLQEAAGGPQSSAASGLLRLQFNFSEFGTQAAGDPVPESEIEVDSRLHLSTGRRVRIAWSADLNH